MTFNQMSYIRFTMSYTCLTFTILIQWIKIIMFYWYFFNIIIPLSNQRYFLLCQVKWIIDLKMGISKLSSMFYILYFSHSSQRHDKCFILMFQPFVNMCINLFSFFYSLFFTQITDNKPINLM